MYIESKINLFRRHVKKSRVIEYYKAHNRFMNKAEKAKDKKYRNIIAKVNAMKEMKDNDRGRE